MYMYMYILMFISKYILIHIDRYMLQTRQNKGQTEMFLIKAELSFKALLSGHNLDIPGFI